MKIARGKSKGKHVIQYTKTGQGPSGWGIENALETDDALSSVILMREK